MSPTGTDIRLQLHVPIRKADQEAFKNYDISLGENN
jgi:hypothetical protein